MSLPVAHGLLGASVVATLLSGTSLHRDWKLLLLGALLGVCPDFDYFLNWISFLGVDGIIGFTHSIVFALGVGTLTSTLVGELSIKGVTAYISATLSHSLLDFFVTQTRGVELFFPFSRERFKLGLPDVYGYSLSHPSLAESISALLKISLIELAVFAPLLALILLAKKTSEDRLSN